MITRHCGSLAIASMRMEKSECKTSKINWPSSRCAAAPQCHADAAPAGDLIPDLPIMSRFLC